MILYKDFKRKVEKDIDAWSEVLITDPISSLMSYCILKFSTNEFIPYIITLLSFIFKLIGALCLLKNNIIFGVILIFIGIVLDGVDGKTSRYIFGKDPELRGTMDFVFDYISLVILFVGVGFLLVVNNLNILLLLFVLYISLICFLNAIISTKFRLYGIYKQDSTKLLLDNKEYSKGITGMIRKIQYAFKKHRMTFHPTTVDSEILVFVLFPLFFNIWLLLLGILFVLADIVICGLVPVFLVLWNEK